VIVGVWLFAVGACDLLRAARDAVSRRRRLVLAGFGCALLALAGAVLEFTAAWWSTVGVLWAVSLVTWVLASSLALHPASRHPAAWRAAAFTAFVVAVVALTFLWAAGPDVPTVPDAWRSTILGRLGPTRTVVLSGVLLFELSTCNILVRLVLDATGISAASNEEDLRGGRLLGPMERIFILVLAVAGELTAAAVVVAAKGLLRFPELQRSRRAQGPTAVSEYFLIGSFASWLLGILGWLLTSIR
jgi:hypothetical protein